MYFDSKIAEIGNRSLKTMFSVNKKTYFSTMRLILLVIGFLFISSVKGQYSPYYFLDTLIDNGITSPEHDQLKGKISWYVDDNSYPKRNVMGKDSVLEAQGDMDVKPTFCLSRSLRYYYNKYSNDPTQDAGDWDYVHNKSDRIITKPDYKDVYRGHFIFVLICNNDTVAVWKSSAPQNEFQKKTLVEFYIWEKRFDDLKFEDEFHPLLSYIHEKKKSGTMNIQLSMYAGKINCHSIRDRGPEILSHGNFRLTITEEQLKEILSYKDKTMDRKKFWDLMYLDNNSPTWGVKQD
jgi:hypothetical protein